MYNAITIILTMTKVLIIHTLDIRIPRFRAHAGSSRASVLKRLGRLVLEFRGFLVSGLRGWNIICSKEGSES